MPTVGIAEAARLAGVNQSTVHRAMRAGKLSYTTDVAGKRRIDVAELGRAFAIRLPAEATSRGGNNAGGRDRSIAGSHCGAGGNDSRTVAAPRQERSRARAHSGAAKRALNAPAGGQRAGSLPAGAAVVVAKVV